MSLRTDTSPGETRLWDSTHGLAGTLVAIRDDNTLSGWVSPWTLPDGTHIGPVLFVIRPPLALPARCGEPTKPLHETVDITVLEHFGSTWFGQGETVALVSGPGALGTCFYGAVFVNGRKSMVAPGLYLYERSMWIHAAHPVLALPEHCERINHGTAKFVNADGTMTKQWFNAMAEYGEEVVWCETCRDYHTPLAWICPHTKRPERDAEKERREREDAAYRETVADRRDSLTIRAVSVSDTLVVLEDRELSSRADLSVAHISSCGWIDIFKDRITIEHPHDDGSPNIAVWSRHVSLTPSQAVELMAAYRKHSPRGCEECGGEDSHDGPEGYCPYCQGYEDGERQGELMSRYDDAPWPRW